MTHASGADVVTTCLDRDNDILTGSYKRGTPATHVRTKLCNKQA